MLAVTRRGSSRKQVSYIARGSDSLISAWASPATQSPPKSQGRCGSRGHSHVLPLQVQAEVPRRLLARDAPQAKQSKPPIGSSLGSTRGHLRTCRDGLVGKH